jgi:hypothetical protein
MGVQPCIFSAQNPSMTSSSDIHVELSIYYTLIRVAAARETEPKIMNAILLPFQTTHSVHLQAK